MTDYHGKKLALGVKTRAAAIPLLLGLLLFGTPRPVQAAAGPDRPLMRDFIGLNGHTVQFKPALYRPVCGLVRDYHPVQWDLGSTTGELPAFPQAKNGVDWDRVYGSWKANGWTIDACLMFETIPGPDWKNLESDARSY